MRFLIIISLILSSCSNNASDPTSTNQKTTANLIVTDEPNKEFCGNVEGMVCKMGCAASIRKELTELEGITGVEIDFKEERSQQIVKVLFNDNKINKEDIHSTIEEINNRQFQVYDVKTVSLID